jgi:hypothetical protein
MVIKLKMVANKVSSCYKNKAEKNHFLAEIDLLGDYINSQERQTKKYRNRARRWKKNFDKLSVDLQNFNEENDFIRKEHDYVISKYRLGIS